MSCFSILFYMILLLAFRPSENTEQGRNGTALVALRHVPALSLQPGTDTTIQLSFSIAPGYHIMADQGNNDNFLYTRLVLTDNEYLHPGAISFSPSKKYDLDDTGDWPGVFEDEFSVRIALSVDREAPQGKQRIKGRLDYQTCNGSKCYFPRELPFEVDFSVQ